MHRLALAATTLLAACGGPFVPTSGTWELTDIAPATDECGFFEGLDVSELTVVATVTAGDEGTFTAAVAAVGVDMTCTLDGKDFSCSQAPNVVDRNEDGVDVVLTYEPFATGTFVDETEATMDAGYSRSCAGTQCDDAEVEDGPFPPCEVSATASLELQ